MKKTVLVFLTAVLLSGSAIAAGWQIHPAYLNGYPDGTVRPYAYLSRQELCQILLRFLPEDAPCENSGYLDVLPAQWSYQAICTMLTLGIYPAPQSAYFEPKKAVPADEFQTVLQNAAKYLDALDAEVSVQGEFVTRAEAARIFNDLFGRCEHPGMQGMLPWRDLSEEDSCYEDIIEACNTHTAENGRWKALG